MYMKGNDILSRAQEANLLETRIVENVRGQEIDLVQWIFDRLHVKAGSSVLELCCGTGSQTLRLLDLVGSSGNVVALDVSGEALEKLKMKAGNGVNECLSTVKSKMEDFPEAVKKLPVKPSYFDLIFCAYGLYYSKKPEETLREARNILKTNGEMAIIGPYGHNNAPLFELLKQAGVEIPPYVLYTSQDFMEQTVIPWAITHFHKIILHTVINRITWDYPEEVINYWKNSTFYDHTKLSAVEKKVEFHFQDNNEFINEKRIMMVEALNG